MLHWVLGSPAELGHRRYSGKGIIAQQSLGVKTLTFAFMNVMMRTCQSVGIQNRPDNMNILNI